MCRDNHYLEDIRVAAELIAEFVEDMTLKDFEADMKTRAAVERQMITMGEAANRITNTFKQAHPEVPWATLIQLRNF